MQLRTDQLEWNLFLFCTLIWSPSSNASKVLRSSLIPCSIFIKSQLYLCFECKSRFFRCGEQTRPVLCGFDTAFSSRRQRPRKEMASNRCGIWENWRSWHDSSLLEGHREIFYNESVLGLTENTKEPHFGCSSSFRSVGDFFWIGGRVFLVLGAIALLTLASKNVLQDKSRISSELMIIPLSFQ